MSRTPATTRPFSAMTRALRAVPRSAAHRLELAALTARIMAGAAVVLILGGCGLPLSGSLAAPEEVTATTDRTDLIRVTWNEVPSADIYYVYRSVSPDADAAEEGDYGPVPYMSVTQPILLDVDTDPTDYYYRVSAGRLSTNEESALSDTAHGIRVAPEIEWQNQATVFGTPGTVRLAIDRTTATVAAYLLTTGDAPGAAATVRVIESDGTLASLGAPTESTDGSDPRVADIAAAGSVYVALVAENPDLAGDRDRVYLYRYDADLEEWLLEAQIPDPVAHPSAPFVSLAAVGEDELLLAYRGDGGEIVTYHYDGSTTTLAAPRATDDTLGNAIPSVGQIDIAAVPGGVALVYELEDDGDPPGGTLRIELSQYTIGTEAWDAATEVYSGGGPDVARGAVSVGVDQTIAVLDNAITVAFHDDAGGLYLVDRTGAPVPGSTTGFPGAPDLASTPIGIAAYSNEVFLFYRDASKEEGAIARFGRAGMTWDEFSPADFTQSQNPDLLNLVAGGGKLFAAFNDGGIARVRAYQ